MSWMSWKIVMAPDGRDLVYEMICHVIVRLFFCVSGRGQRCKQYRLGTDKVRSEELCG